jgi:hypothetical protein
MDDVFYLETMSGDVLPLLYNSHNEEVLVARKKRSSTETVSFPLIEVKHVERAKINLAGSVGVLAVGALVILTFAVIGIAASGGLSL